MIKLLLILAIIGCFVLIGVIIKNYFFARVECFSQFKNLCKELENQIFFLKTDKSTILKNFSIQNNFVKEFANSFLQGGAGKISILKQPELTLLNNFILSIGKSNVEGEIANIRFYETSINTQLVLAQNSYSKYGMFSVKMSILAGTLFAIILI